MGIERGTKYNYKDLLVDYMLFKMHIDKVIYETPTPNVFINQRAINWDCILLDEIDSFAYIYHMYTVR